MVNSTYKAQVGLERANPAVYFNIVGVVISLIVFLGIVGWGAKMILRDRAGAPVVQALDGPMRISPDDPGGVMASHQGLTVNEVASSQKKMALEDRLRLAPRAINLLPEDQPISLLLASKASLKDTPLLRSTSQGTLDTEVEFSITNINGHSIRKMPVPSIPASRKVSTEILIIKDDLTADSSLVSPYIGSGPMQSPRPRTRSLASIVSSVSKLVTVKPQAISQGKPMAQLGAFGSQSIAMQAWLDLSQRHADYLTGKKHIILRAEVGGGTIYRLRVHGLSDMAEARRLCKALNGRNTECYSVMMN
tara:strand:+ start:499 stop:1416 length:918 start_codon:yes stop_codon:yes gene_type:complete